MRPSSPDPETLSRLVAEQVKVMTDRGLGGLEVRSNLARSEQFLTTGRGARNLLTKARRELAAGRPERATSYLDRAVRLPYNEMEEAPTAAYEAHLMLFTAVAEALEGSDEADSAWLDAAEAILPRCGENALEDLRQALRAINNDYQLTPAQRRRIRALAPGPPGLDGLGDLTLARAGDDEATQRVVITEVLIATNAYEEELARRTTRP